MSGYGYKPPPINLLNQKLTLSPETEAIIARIEAEMAARAWREALAQPDWEQLFPSIGEIELFPPLTLPEPKPAWQTYKPPATPPAPKLNPGPGSPRAGEMKDVLSAFFQLPAIQMARKQLEEEAMDRGKQHVKALKLQWNTAPVGEKIGMVSFGVVVASAFIVPILYVKETRKFAFEQLKGIDIPVPKVPGLTFRILDHGAGVSVPLVVPGLKLDAQAQFPGAGPAVNVMFSWDVTQVWSAFK